MNAYVKLAKDAIKEFVENGRVLIVPKDLPDKMLKNRAGVFVSIHKKPINPSTTLPQENSGQVGTSRGRQINHEHEGELRGCIGTFLPTKNNIAQEIIDNAISACSRDYRFSPITDDELDNLEVSVDVLDKPELIINNLIINNSFLISKLNVKKYGVIVKSADGRTGLLLPDLEGVNSPDQQIQICRQKAGISPDEPIDIYKFEVIRYTTYAPPQR